MNPTAPRPFAGFTSLFIFAIAMGFLEAIVVVYMRELYYPQGFAFPVNPMPPWIIGTEMIRELCTLFMLGAVAFITGNTFIRRLAAFLFVFGIWDLFYYLALWLLLDWPTSLLTWDILFLIPITWTGPVLAPVLCSLIMIVLALLLERFRHRNQVAVPPLQSLLFFMAGSVFIIAAFMYDFTLLLIRGNYFSTFFSLTENPKFLNEMFQYEPVRFQWEIFFVGLLLILTGLFPLLKKTK